ncbi:hypothetical protein OCC_11859 [Thermococcus litoralis DSM 5473]|uniref:PqqD family protein n=2 Tax=Thermococcus TaxID=2263 RepID=H3ZNY7_THELN|nr:MULTISPECIES: PqqD family peptide modification chaperone [Thermococcus]EHR78328.1 hypothetical protein OCC_11859 [Thermococcus litoralis DSM 5473]KUJ99009.1 MAG: Uncharacterized protein XD43_1326 [Thermococcales archaeon 44_46]MCA6214232.1 PqqD family peptide modification chaperone [Thermococcus bergensis]HIH73709.1 PqqD family peptide modification chaperone [Thermococcaceae archaeon]
MEESLLFSPFYKPKIKPLHIISYSDYALCYDYSTGRIFTVNKMGELVLKYSNGSLTIKEIANYVKKDIDEEIDIEIITKDILEFIKHLSKLGLLQNDKEACE